MSATAQYNMPEFVVGNTWPGVPLYRVTPVPAGAGNLASVEIQFRQDNVKSPAYTAKLSTSDATQIAIVSASDWSFTIYSQTLPLPAGTFFQSVKLTDDSPTPKSYTYTTGTITGILPATR